MYFNYNSPITRKKFQSSLTTAKGQWPEEQRNDTYTFILFFLFCVKVPYSVEKFHTVKYLKNCNVKISMKFLRQENFMKFYISRPILMTIKMMLVSVSGYVQSYKHVLTIVIVVNVCK